MALQLTAPSRGPGYRLGDLKGDVAYTFFRCIDLNIAFVKRSGVPTRVTDALARQMCREGLIDEAILSQYEARVRAEFATREQLAAFDRSTVSQLYRHIHRLRKEQLGVSPLEQMAQLKKSRGVTFDPSNGIDQRPLKDQCLARSQAVVLALFQPELYTLMEADLKALRGKQLYFLVSKNRGDELPDRAMLESWLPKGLDPVFLEADEQGIQDAPELKKRIAEGQACLLAYGEEGLLSCRGLRLDAVVSAIPTGYHAQAMTNTLSGSAACVVYIPKHLDITPWVPLTDRSRLTYSQLYRLWLESGEMIYSYSIDELYRRYPQHFLNIYHTGPVCPEAKPNYPMKISCTGLSDFDAQRDLAIERHLDRYENLSFHSAYFTPELKQAPISRNSTQKQPGILVHTARIKKARGSQVLSTGGDLRGTLSGMNDALISNFLFFLTPKLGTLYNDLRADRPYEQADGAAGHLDYMLCYRDGLRVETFPLFRKACIAMLETGEFLFFRFRLGGGSIRADSFPIRWESSQVDTDEPSPVRVYTPYYSLPDEEGDRQTYRKAVGQGRVNLVILQDKLCALRRGDVLLPSVGVVISLEEGVAAPLLDSLKPLENGYYDVSGLDLTVHLDPPAGIDPTLWKRVKWAYGGGMSLICDGEGLCDGDDTQARFRREGWLSPLSRQTQESTLHSLVKHPRTAIGTTENGDLVLLVFSGRTWRSTGADYREMVVIARQLFPDIRQLMNMDGGGSAMLGLVQNGSFMELSFPSTSTGSCAGMTRPVNTVLYIPIT